MKFCLHGSARSVKEAVDRAKRAEALGFEAIFFADSQMNNVDPYQAMAMCGVSTKKIASKPSASARLARPTASLTLRAEPCKQKFMTPPVEEI